MCIWVGSCCAQVWNAAHTTAVQGLLAMLGYDSLGLLLMTGVALGDKRGEEEPLDCISGGLLSFRTKLVSISNVAHVQPCIEAQKCMHLDMCTHIHTDANVTCPKALRVQHWIWVNFDVLGCSNLLAWMVSKVLLNWSASFLEWFVTGLPSVGAMLNATMNRQQLVAQDVTLRDRPGESSHVEGIHS